jgi:hypothetical protein
MQKYFTIELDAWDETGEGEQTVEGDKTTGEVVGFNKDGTIDIAFNDRNERTYLKFSLADLMAALAHYRGEA